MNKQTFRSPNETTEPPIPDKLRKRLEELGFKEQEFEPKVKNRFIVNIKSLPSHLIKGVNFPVYLGKNTDPKWSSLTLTLYCPINGTLEKDILELDCETLHIITVKQLDPVGEIVSTWKFSGEFLRSEFSSLNWSDKGEVITVSVVFQIKDATISYK